MNIGTRQTARQRGRNVLDVDYDESAIRDAIADRLAVGRLPSEPIYGDGRAGPRIAEILATSKLSIEKVITY